MNKSYTESHQKKNFGELYDKKLNNKFERIIYNLEIIILKLIIKKYFNNKIDSYLDFACGTGRVTCVIEKYSKESIGVDVSEEMLKIAEKKCKKIKFIKRNILEKPLIKQFDLITAFRFFVNAEELLRINTLKTVKAHLKKEGLFIFNIHMNRYSFIGFQFFVRKKLFKQNVINTMSYKHMKKLLENEGFKIIKTYSLAHLPGRLNFVILPEKVLKSTELSLSRFNFLKYISKDIIIIAKKEN